jgi:hypothetical protein
LLMQERYRENRPMSTEVVMDILEKAKERKETREPGSTAKKGKGKASKASACPEWGWNWKWLTRIIRAPTMSTPRT